jgi:hypothetical protein
MKRVKIGSVREDKITLTESENGIRHGYRMTEELIEKTGGPKFVLRRNSNLVGFQRKGSHLFSKFDKQ